MSERSTTSSSGQEKQSGSLSRWFPFILSACIMFIHLMTTSELLGGPYLKLGSVTTPTFEHVIFNWFWGITGLIAALTLAWGLTGVEAMQQRVSSLRRAVGEVDDRQWILFLSFLALVVPVLIRQVLLTGAELTDDEAAYRFSARLLASARLYVESPPWPLFHDRIFQVNDGRMYSQYFLGWPALLVPGVWLGVEGYVNAACSALTVPALFLVLRRLAGSRWAVLGGLLYLTSPFVQVCAATMLSHTSCVTALAWTLWFALRARDRDAPAWAHAGVGAAFSVAFFIRPVSALGIGFPFLLWWLVGLSRISWRQRAVAVVSFVGISAVFAGLFLLANRATTGSPWLLPYQRCLEYFQENGLRYGWASVENATVFVNPFEAPGEALYLQVIAFLRLNADLFGWPASLFFLLFAVRRTGWLLWASFFCYFVFYLTCADSGIDTFGPVHYLELALPAIVLTVLGVHTLYRWLEEVRPRAPEAVGGRVRGASVLLLLLAFVVVSAFGFMPLRLGSIHRASVAVTMPERVIEEEGITEAVIFAPQPLLPLCPPTVAFRFFRPTNRPDLDDDVLWLNHLSLDLDRRLMSVEFPDRRGYVLVHEPPCAVRILPLDNPDLVVPDQLFKGEPLVRPEDVLP